MSALIAVLLIFAPFGNGALISQLRNIQVVYQWNLLNYSIPPGYQVDPTYRPDLTFLTGLEVLSDSIILATPRIMTGNPATLSYIPRDIGTGNKQGPQTFPLQAYPDWSWHVNQANPTNCNTTLVSVFRAKRDKCNRLWVLDTGTYQQPPTADFRFICPPKIVVFDIATKKLVKLITVARDVVTPITLLINFEFDYLDASSGTNSCDIKFIYLADYNQPAIIVYNVPKNLFYRLSHPYMFPNPDNATITVVGESFTQKGGILGLTVINGVLYFNAFASVNFFSIPTSALQQEFQAGNGSQLPVKKALTLPSQTNLGAVDPLNNCLIYNPITQTSIVEWCPGSQQSQNQKLLANNSELLQLVNDYKADYYDSTVIWFISSRAQRFFNMNVNPQEINLRVMKLQYNRSG